MNTYIVVDERECDETQHPVNVELYTDMQDALKAIDGTKKLLKIFINNAFHCGMKSGKNDFFEWSVVGYSDEFICEQVNKYYANKTYMLSDLKYGDKFHFGDNHTRVLVDASRIHTRDEDIAIAYMLGHELHTMHDRKCWRVK